MADCVHMTITALVNIIFTRCTIPKSETDLHSMIINYALMMWDIIFLPLKIFVIYSAYKCWECSQKMTKMCNGKNKLPHITWYLIALSTRITLEQRWCWSLTQELFHALMWYDEFDQSFNIHNNPVA